MIEKRSASIGKYAARLVLAGTVFLAVYDPMRPAHAYLDPGTGSILLQLLLGGVAGGLVIMKLYWQFKDLFGRGGSANQGDIENKEAQ